MPSPRGRSLKRAQVKRPIAKQGHCLSSAHLPPHRGSVPRLHCQRRSASSNQSYSSSRKRDTLQLLQARGSTPQGGARRSACDVNKHSPTDRTSDYESEVAGSIPAANHKDIAPRAPDYGPQGDWISTEQLIRRKRVPVLFLAPYAEHPAVLTSKSGFESQSGPPGHPAVKSHTQIVGSNPTPGTT